jgi:multimeric flavodoxin WrbA
VREPGNLRILGISTTAMDANNPRYSTSDALLEISLEHAAELGAETKMIKINDLRFRHCEGYYSKSAHACTWPCSITEMDSSDEMEKVYEALVFWCDAVIVSTPIRWGSASSLYFKMIERMNCIQNQITIADNVLIRNKTAAFIITGGQDNIQAVAGQMLMFFAELGFDFPQFPFIAHSRGWSAEDMENNVKYVKTSKELRSGAQELAARTIEKARQIVEASPVTKTERAGRKGHKMDVMAIE